MSNNLFLPEKKVIEVEHSLSVAGTYTWTAPDLNRDGSDYEIEVALYGGGGGSGRFDSDNNEIGGSGGFISGFLLVNPNNVYTLSVGSGGTRSSFSNTPGSSGQSSILYKSGAEIVRANGGSGGGEITSTYIAISGDAIVANSLEFTEKVNLGTFTRGFNGNSEWGLYYGGASNISLSSTVRGGVGGNYTSTSSTGSSGRIILRYKIKENITDNVPVLI